MRDYLEDQGEPHQRLSNAAQLGKLAEDQFDRLLDTAVRILFEPPILGLQISDRRGDNQLPATRFRVSRFDGTLPQ